MTLPVLVVDGKKACGRPDCQQANPQLAANFNRLSKSPSGLRSSCRSCEKRMRETPKARQHEKVRNKERYAREGEVLRAKALEWYVNNREAAIRRTSAYQAEHRDQVNERFRRYRKEGRYRHLDRAHAAKRRALLAQRPAEHIDLDALYERDSGVCQLCYQVVDRALRWPLPLSESVDHVVPLARGGGHTWANVQLAHLSCNMKKGARL